MGAGTGRVTCLHCNCTRAELARGRTEIHAAWWCAASSRPVEVPNICCELQHAVLRAIWNDLERISDRNFRKFSRPQNFSFELARDRATIHAAWWCAAFLTTRRGPEHLSAPVASVSMLCRVRFRAIRSGFRIEIFEKFSRSQNFAFEIARDRAKIHAAW